MGVQSTAEERSGEREGLEGDREAGERDCRHEWCKEERVEEIKEENGDKVLGLLGYWVKWAAYIGPTNKNRTIWVLMGFQNFLLGFYHIHYSFNYFVII